MEHIYDIAIIGGGPAGYTAALYAARAGFNCIVMEKMSVGGQMALTDMIDNYPGFEEGVDGITLGMKMQQSAERFGAKTVYDDISSVELSGDVKTLNGFSEKYSAKAVIIATGAYPRQLGIEGEETFAGRGLHYCAHCDGRFYKDKEVIVVGGGNTAAADALYLSRLCKRVTVIHRRNTLRATKIYHEPLMKCENISFIWDSAVVDYISDKKIIGVKVKNLKTDEISDISCDGVFVSIGREPETGMFKDILSLDKYGYIIAGEDTKTSIPGVFAVGDVRTKPLRQVVTAVGDGATAVHFAEEYLS